MQFNTANSISIMTRDGDDKKEALLHGLYPAVNFFNHSSEPSIVSSLQGHAQLILTAIKPIKKGKRIFFDYAKHNSSKTSYEQGTDVSDKYSTTGESGEVIGKESTSVFPTIKMIDKLTEIKQKLRDTILIVENFGKTNGKVPNITPIINDAAKLVKKTSGGRGKNSAKFLVEIVNVLESFYQNFHAPCVKLSG